MEVSFGLNRVGVQKFWDKDVCLCLANGAVDCNQRRMSLVHSMEALLVDQMAAGGYEHNWKVLLAQIFAHEVAIANIGQIAECGGVVFF